MVKYYKSLMTTCIPIYYAFITSIQQMTKEGMIDDSQHLRMKEGFLQGPITEPSHQKL